EDVDSFMKQPGNETADIVLKKLDEQYQKYKFMELNLAQKKRRLKGQIPEIKQTLEILKYMQKKKVSVFFVYKHEQTRIVQQRHVFLDSLESTSSLETRFLLADNLYCKASVPPTDKVCLWLGANVMLEYDIDEAQALLEKNLLTATKNLDSLEEDLDFLRDQFTTTEGGDRDQEVLFPRGSGKPRRPSHCSRAESALPPEPLLTRGIPDLELDAFSGFDLHQTGEEIHPHRRVRNLGKAALGEAADQTRLAHRGIPDDNQPELIQPDGLHGRGSAGLLGPGRGRRDGGGQARASESSA
ncbi:hypothetical protein Celaphus_00008155, partial [Cervus elaphus hippelaphus]